MGAHAVLSILDATGDSESKVICLKANTIVSLSLMECVKNTLEIANAIDQKDFNKALELRGPYVILLKLQHCILVILINLTDVLFW